METIKLDLVPGKKMPSLHASQYDDGREHGIDLFENGVAYKLDGTETLTINERKVDNNICSMDITNTFAQSSHIEFASFLQMCACAGSNFCELRISKGDVDIGTLNFILEIEPDPTADGIESESEIRNLETQIREITEQVIGDDYYTAEQTDEAIATATEGKADASYVDTELAKKADKTDTYTKTQVDNALNNKMNSANPTGTGSLSLNRKAGSIVGSNSVAMGTNTRATGTNTTALGNDTLAYGENSVAMGSGSIANGTNSVAIGNHTGAKSNNQFVFGKYNKDDNNNAYAEIVGNGTTAFTKSNARTLDWQGNETLAGDLTFNRNKSLTSEIARLDGRIDNLPAPMIFKGTLGVGGTIQSLPTASASNEGFTYKVITDGTYAGQTAKVGDVFTSNGSAWVYIPSGDEDNDTWRAIKVNGVEKLGNGISSGAVDFEDTTNVKFTFDGNGNKVKATLSGIYTSSEVNDLLDDKADKSDTYTKAQVDDIVYGILPDDTASGSVANFETDLALPIKSLEVDVNAVQASGTPTPATPLPISGWSAISLVHCGKNMFNSSIYDGYKQSDGTYRGQANSLLGIKTYLGDFIGKQITFSAFLDLTVSPAPTNAKVGAKINGVDVYGNNINSGSTGYSSITITPQTENDYINLSFGSGDTNSYTFYKLQLEIGNARTEYTDCVTPTTEVIELGGTYYGGRLLQDKDGHRRFEVTHGIKLFGDISFNRSNNGGAWSSYLFYSRITDKANGGAAKCSNYEYVNNQTTSTVQNEKLITASASNFVYIRDDAYTTASDFKTANANTQLVYELTTPYTIDLPDGEPITTFIGTNNIYADTGDTEVVFKSSVNDYVSAHSGGNLLGMGGVYLGGAKSGGSEEETNDTEDTEKVKLDETKVEIKEIGDTKKLGGE